MRTWIFKNGDQYTGTVVKSEDGHEIMKIEHKTFESCERTYLMVFGFCKKHNLGTKVIGKTLFMFNKKE